MAYSNTSDIRTANSTSYVDVAGLHFGLQRLAQESTPQFLDRLYRAANARRDHSFQGTTNEICLQLGLEVRKGARLSYAFGNLVVSTSLKGIRLTDPGHNLDQLVPIVTVASDGVWEWRMLSDVVTDLDAVPNVTATLLGADVPALQLVRQTNLNVAINEPVAGARVQLDHIQLVPGSERFNKPVLEGSYTLDYVSGHLAFTIEPPAGLAVSYQYQALPYDLVCAEGAVFGLLDPGVSSIFTAGSGVVHQVQEVIQSVMETDRSYWSR